MRVTELKRNPKTYTCNAYLVLGDWNRLEDVNTLVDVGVDGFIIDEIEKLATGCGKKPVDQVILTHNHFDHAGGISAIKGKYGCRVFAHSKGDEVDELLKDGRIIRLGDRNFEVIHAPGHSNDSICLYCPEERVLFSGDTTLRIMTAEGSFTPGFIKVLERIRRLDIDVIYSGHDEPVRKDARNMIESSLANVGKSQATGPA